MPRIDFLRGHGGAPKMYESPEEMVEIIKDYFDECEGEPLYNKDGDPVIARDGSQVMTGKEAPTMSGLAIVLGMSTGSLRDYAKDNEFSAIVESAKQYVENYVEKQLFTKDGARGAEFSLTNNFGWINKKEQRIDANMGISFIEIPEEPPKITDSPTLDDLKGIAAKLKEEVDECKEDGSKKENNK